MEKGHVYVDVTAAMEYAVDMAKKEYCIDNPIVRFNGLAFWMYNNNMFNQDCCNVNIPIDDFIVEE